jgi:exopolysaccharide production protein ExoQ
MATVVPSENMTWKPAPLLDGELSYEVPLWEEVFSWLTLLPTLFITVSGRIQTESAPVAFRFTAMEEDSLGRRITRLACSLLILLLISTRFREILAVCRRSKLLLLFPALAFVSMVWSQNPRHTLVDALNLLLTTLFAMYVYMRYPGDRLISFLTLAAFISLLLCALAVVAFPSVGIDAFQQNAWRGIFGQRNNCAATCTLFLMVGLHAKTRGLMEQLIAGSVIALSLIFIVMSGSRTGWILAAIGLVLTYGLRFTAQIRSLDRILFLMVLAVPITLIALFIGSNLNEILAAMDKDPTLTQRTIIWAQVIPSIAKHPLLGYGYSAFWQGLNGESMQAVLTTGWMEGQAQDGYLDTLLQLGLVGLIPLVVVFLRGFVQSIGAMERKLLSHAVLWAIVLLPLVLLDNIGESSLLLPLGIPWFYALIALVILAFPNPHAEEF